MKNILSKEIQIPYKNMGSNMEDILRQRIINNYEGKCISDGYIKPNTVRLLTHSCGIIDAKNIKYTVAFECQICKPVEGMLIQCKCVQITKAGVRAVYATNKEDEPSPINVFIAREHHINNKLLNNVRENNIIKVKVIGIRYELNDKCIAILGEIKEISKENN